MKVMDRLNKVQKQQLDRLRSQQKKPPNEYLSERDLEELMGVHRDTYKRVNGAVRRR